MTTIHIDFETRSTVDLKKAGLDVYARHPSTDAWCMAWAFDDQPVALVGAQARFDLGYAAPVREFVRGGGTVIAHNAAFELAIWNNIMVPRYGWPELKPEQVQCTMTMAYAMALPGSLEKAAAAVGIEAQKDMAGHRVMMQLSKPREIAACPACKGRGVDCTMCEGTGQEVIWWNDPAKFEHLYRYCKQDIEVERQLYKRLLPLSESERRLWLLDQKINNRGVAVDVDAARKAIALVAVEKKRLDEEMRVVTGNVVATCTATGQLTQWLRWRGLEVPSVAKADVLEMLDRELPKDCRRALLLRQEAAKSSTAKLDAMIEVAAVDGRARGMFQYHGAGTGRWAGRKIQLQNLPRPKLSQNEIDDTFWDLTKQDALDRLRFFYGSPLTVLSDCLRGFLRAAPGHDLLASDFSAIEARVLAWLAGQEDILDVFRSGQDIYCHEATPIYGHQITKADKDERMVGKVSVLALGFGGGIGAFGTMARGYSLDLAPVFERLKETFSEIEIENAELAYVSYKNRVSQPLGREAGFAADIIKQRWRRKNVQIKTYWEHLEETAQTAVLRPGLKIQAGAEGREVTYRMSGSFLWCALPSGRVLCYPYPKVEEIETPWGTRKTGLTYMTVDGITGKWGRTKTYGGKLAENVTQAVARDLLAEAMIRLEDAGYPVVMHVHDEVVCELPEGAGSVEEMEQIMSVVPAWAAGLPIAAEGWRGRRYRK